VGGRRYGQPEPDEPEYEVDDEAKLTLREAAPVEGARFEYVYDLGDSWTHEVIVEEIEPPDPEFRSPECLAGERACPPEDCGGPPGYEEFLEAIRDPRHPEHKDHLDWIGGRFDAEAFDLAAVNRRLKLRERRTTRSIPSRWPTWSSTTSTSRTSCTATPSLAR
jgi:Plasmid pRiA4b ORF-3-like protein